MACFWRQMRFKPKQGEVWLVMVCNDPKVNKGCTSVQTQWEWVWWVKEMLKDFPLSDKWDLNLAWHPRISGWPTCTMIKDIPTVLVDFLYAKTVESTKIMCNLVILSWTHSHCSAQALFALCFEQGHESNTDLHDQVEWSSANFGAITHTSLWNVGAKRDPVDAFFDFW